jgi:hypothetical protein
MKLIYDTWSWSCGVFFLVLAACNSSWVVLEITAWGTAYKLPTNMGHIQKKKTLLHTCASWSSPTTGNSVKYCCISKKKKIRWHFLFQVLNLTEIFLEIWKRNNPAKQTTVSEEGIRLYLPPHQGPLPVCCVGLWLRIRKKKSGHLPQCHHKGLGLCSFLVAAFSVSVAAPKSSFFFCVVLACRYADTSHFLV